MIAAGLAQFHPHMMDWLDPVRHARVTYDLGLQAGACVVVLIGMYGLLYWLLPYLLRRQRGGR